MSGLKFLCTSLFVVAMLASGLLESSSSPSHLGILQLAALLN